LRTPDRGRARPESVELLQAELALALRALADTRASSESAEPGPALSFLPSNGFLASLQEIRQPLTAISGYTELLLGEKMGLLGASQRRFLSRIRSAVRRMDQELAATTRALSGLVAAAAREPTDLAALIEQALEVIHDDLHAKELTVRLDMPSGPLPTSLDPDSVRTIVARLLTNAADASPRGREILLRVTPAPAERVLILTVADLGHGVPPADLSRVFSGSMWRDPVRGLGQDAPGLALVKSLTESIGGRVWVDSQDGGGTTFSVVLPSL
jgi:signal transduction histidine kinase